MPLVCPRVWRAASAISAMIASGLTMSPRSQGNKRQNEVEHLPTSLRTDALRECRDPVVVTSPRPGDGSDARSRAPRAASKSIFGGTLRSVRSGRQPPLCLHPGGDPVLPGDKNPGRVVVMFHYGAGAVVSGSGFVSGARSCVAHSRPLRRRVRGRRGTRWVAS